MHTYKIVALGCLLGLPFASRAIDQNANQQNDVWEMLYNASGLAAGTDTDGDKFSNAAESIAGTNPFDPLSYPAIDGLHVQPGHVTNAFYSQAGKKYTLQAATTLGGWQTVSNSTGTGGTQEIPSAESGAPLGFYRLAVSDQDTDGDSLNDWEELAVGFNPKTNHTQHYDQTDNQRLTATTLNAMSTVTVAVLDGEISERWPDNGVVAIRRSSGFKPITVNFSVSGTAARDTDYAMPAGTSIVMNAGVREVWVEFQPVADALDGESTETITLTAAPGTNYVLGSPTVATVNLANETATSLPNAKSAARFLVQAAFGPDQDDSGDADQIPENVEQVMAMGFDAWIDDQFTRPIGLIQPFTDYVPGNIPSFGDPKEGAWWNRAMGVASLVPGGPTQLPDPLRQRLTFALSQILVVSDRPETLAVLPAALANYYDTLMTNAFANYRDLLFHVTCHPSMGFYLSHLMNQKPNPTNNVFPDENYAREVMQLFSIGLWQLNQDGTRKLGTNGLPIPTYDNNNITEFARVFTGFSYGPSSNTSFGNAQPNFVVPMKMYDSYHDCNPKTLLNGATLPLRVPSVPDVGTAGLLDINGAVDNLFWHTNVAPFICRQLIQRFVTSNPTTGYVARVAAKFNDNGSGVRGDLKTVLKAILLDTEARDPAKMSDPLFGKQREPFLRVVNFARAFNASAQSGFYQLDTFFMDHYEEPMKSPSVFNFYLPGYIPPGAIHAAGLVGPEFQIVNAGSAISCPNYYLKALADNDLHRWGTSDPTRATRPNLTQELAMATDVDGLIRRLDLVLTYGLLTPREFQNIRDAVNRINSGVTSTWANERVQLAIYLVVTSPEFCVMR